jgi:hypothetical protein
LNASSVLFLAADSRARGAGAAIGRQPELKRLVVVRVRRRRQRKQVVI